jgi:protocatechuate 3,4-dioxygenase beta subunit
MRTFLVLLATLFALTHNITQNKADVFPTKLQVTVLDEAGNPVIGAEVELYKSEADYEAGKNPVGTKMKTDAKGKATFSELEPVIYFVKAEKGDLDNSGAGTHTEALVAKKINKVNVIIS